MRARRQSRHEQDATDYQRSGTEDSMEATIRDLVATKHGRVWHIRDSRGAPETQDMPDLLILIPGRILLIESKSQKRPLTPGQLGVKHLMATVTECTLGVMRPDPYPGEMGFDQVLQIIADTTA